MVCTVCLTYIQMTAVNTLKPIYFTTTVKICTCSIWLQKCFNCIVSTSLFYRYKCICGRFSVETELELGFLRTVKTKMFMEIYLSFPIVNFKNSHSISSPVCTDGYRLMTSLLYLFLLRSFFLGGGGYKYKYL